MKNEVCEPWRMPLPLLRAAVPRPSDAAHAHAYASADTRHPFSLLIYFWARRVAVPAERSQRMIDEVVLIETGH